MASVKDVLDKLQSKAHPEQLKGMAKYGMPQASTGLVENWNS